MKLSLLLIILLSLPILAAESPVIDKGDDYDRISGNKYFWSIRENGTVEIIGQETRSATYFKISISDDGNMVVIKANRSWRYLANSDICQESSGVVMRGLQCIPSVVQQFFSKHEFSPPHPMSSRVAEI